MTEKTKKKTAKGVAQKEGKKDKKPTPETSVDKPKGVPQIDKIAVSRQAKLRSLRRKGRLK